MLDLRNWLNDRNSVLINFLLCFCPDESDDLDKLPKWMYVVLAFCTEVTYNIKCGNIVLPFSLSCHYTHVVVNRSQAFRSDARLDVATRRSKMSWLMDM